MRLVYIGGIGRSGSTLVERVLNELPGVCALGEVAQMWQLGVRENAFCGCGVPFRECELWTGIGERAFGGWQSIDVDRIHTLRDAVGRIRSIPWLAGDALPERRRVQVTEYLDYYTRIYSAAAEITGAQAVIDSSKQAALAFCLRRSSSIDLRVLHVLRDPRGVAYSYLKRVHDPATDGVREMPKMFPVGRYAMAWNVHNAAFGLLARLGPGPQQPAASRLVHRLWYEEFLADPRAAADTLAGIVGVRGPGVDLSYLGDQDVEFGVLHSVSGNRMRYRTGRVPLRVDDAWRTALPRSRRGLVGMLCAPLLLAYGYPWRGGRAPQQSAPSPQTGCDVAASPHHMQGHPQ